MDFFLLFNHRPDKSPSLFGREQKEKVKNPSFFRLLCIYLLDRNAVGVENDFSIVRQNATDCVTPFEMKRPRKCLKRCHRIFFLCVYTDYDTLILTMRITAECGSPTFSIVTERTNAYQRHFSSTDNKSTEKEILLRSSSCLLKDAFIIVVCLTLTGIIDSSVTVLNRFWRSCVISFHFNLVSIFHFLFSKENC